MLKCRVYILETTVVVFEFGLFSLINFPFLCPVTVVNISNPIS
jgi:hypothetical protein